MAVDLHFEESLLRKLKLEDPWLPPKPWESVPSESGASDSLYSNHASFNGCLYDLSSVSVSSSSQIKSFYSFELKAILLVLSIEALFSSVYD